MSSSDVRRIMQQIDNEVNAAQQAFYGLSLGNAQHRFINERYNRLGVLQNELSEFIGNDAAMGIIVDRLNNKEVL